MKIIILFFVACFILPVFAQRPEGWASMNGGTMGGAGGQVVTVDNAGEFLAAINGDGALTILVNGTIALSGMHSVGSNKTIVGVLDRGVISGGGLTLRSVSNIIVRNLLFQNSSSDAFNITDRTHHVWIDHCDLTNAFDDLLDIGRGSDFVTVSWNLFFNHDKTCLLGYSDNEGAQDTGRLRVTYHHNFFNGTRQRHPRVRFSALAHVYNNFYIGNLYGVASTMNAEALVEGNYFRNVAEPTLVGYASSGPGDLVERQNTFDNCGAPQTRGQTPEPPYSYRLTTSGEIPAMLERFAGRKGYVGTVDVAEPRSAPGEYLLEQNCPNPFNARTKIVFYSPRAGKVTVKIYDIHGQLVGLLAELNGEQLTTGRQELTFDGEKLPSGMYFYTMNAGNFSQTKKMILLK